MHVIDERLSEIIESKDQAIQTIFLSFESQPYHLSTNSRQVRKQVETLYPFILNAEKGSGPLFSIYALVQPVPKELINEVIEKGMKVAIDQSLYQATCSEGLRYNLDEDKYFIFVLKTHTLYFFSTLDKVVYIFHPEDSVLSLETNRLLKSLISITCESLGQLMLHASGIVTPEGATLFLGDSRNGKTTILLEALTHFNANMLSCDTSFLRIEGGIIKARGWPSNFSVSVGTMYDYQCLHPLLPQKFRNLTYKEAWDIYDKHVVDAKDVIKELCVRIIPEAEVKTMVALNFSPEAKTELVPLTSRKGIKSWIKKVYLGSRDTLYPNWHQLLSVSDTEIEANIERMIDFVKERKIDFYQLNWAPSAQTFLRRVSTLDSFHKLNSGTKG